MEADEILVLATGMPGVAAVTAGPANGAQARALLSHAHARAREGHGLRR